MDRPRVPITVQEMPDFAEVAERILGERGHEDLIHFLALNPEAGAVVPQTGGVRKLRWAVPGRGKRGGARVVYYFHSRSLPLLALDIYAKNEREDLSPEQKKELRRIVNLFVKGGRGGK